MGGILYLGSIFLAKHHITNLALMGIGISLFALGAFWLLCDAVRCEYQ